MGLSRVRGYGEVNIFFFFQAAGDVPRRWRVLGPEKDFAGAGSVVDMLMGKVLPGQPAFRVLRRPHLVRTWNNTATFVVVPDSVQQTCRRQRDTAVGIDWHLQQVSDLPARSERLHDV